MGERAATRTLRRGRRLGCGAVALAAVAAGALGVASQAGAAAPSPLRYVALGDSYAAGPLDGPAVGPPACVRSTASYPYLVAAALHARLVDVACSGADSADLTTRAQHAGLPPQVGALSPSTGLVTLTDGGNDHGLFVHALLDCAATDALDVVGVGAPCERRHGITFTDEVAADAVTLAHTFATVRADAPHARVYVLGYPDILAPGGRCYPEMPFTRADATYLNDLELDLNATIAHAAARAGVHYVDTYGPFRGHGSCARGSAQWINAIVPTRGGIPVHPNAAGERALAAILERAMAGGAGS